MKVKPRSYSLIVVLLVSLAIIIRSLTFTYLATKLFPVIIGGLVFVLAAIELGRELLAKGESEMVVEPGEAKGEIGRYLWIGAWIVGFSVAIYLVGFLIAIPVFILSYLKLDRAGWLIATGIAGVTTVFLYVVFELLLQVHLYRGLLLTW